MSYSTITHALVNYVESHLENFNLKEMAGSFGFSEIHLRELFGDWNDTEKMLENFRNRLIRKRLGELIVEAGREDRQAYEQIKLLYSRM